MHDDHQLNNQPQEHRQESPAPDNDQAAPATPEETRTELRGAIQGSNEILACATTALTPFPDTVSLDRAKLTITKRTFFRTAEVVSIPVEDILNVTMHMGPVFSTIKVTTRIMSAGKPYSVGLFWRKEASRFKNIAQGYALGLQRKINLSLLGKDELVEMLVKLGKDERPA